MAKVYKVRFEINPGTDVLEACRYVRDCFTDHGEQAPKFLAAELVIELEQDSTWLVKFVTDVAPAVVQSMDFDIVR